MTDSTPLEGWKADMLLKILDMRNMANFLKNEDGAVTVDWVVLTALIIALIAAAFTGVDGGVASLTAKLAAYLQNLKMGV